MHDETNARCGQDIPCRRNTWNMGWNVYGACMEYVRIMLEYVRNVYGMQSMHVGSATFPRHFWIQERPRFSQRLEMRQLTLRVSTAAQV